MNPKVMAAIYPVDPAQAQAVLAMLKGAAPTNSSLPPPAKLTLPEVTNFTERQQQIIAALLDRELNESQQGVLEAYLKNYQVHGGHMDIASVADYLMNNYFGVGPDKEKAINLVKGALRSFGKRLNKTLTPATMPMRVGRDRDGDGVADPEPLLALVSIRKDGIGQNCHQLTPDGAIAVAHALGANLAGHSAFSVCGEGSDYAPDEIIGLAMTATAAALLERVARSMGVSREEAIRRMAAQAGAG